MTPSSSFAFDLPRIVLGTFPTAVERLAGAATPLVDVWVKRDDRSGEAYGGNKVRKLEPVLFDAKRKGKKRLLTVGAAGSHHVLATTLYGKQHGFRVAAVLVPQPTSAHVEENLRAGLGLGLEAHRARGYADTPLQVLAHMGLDTAFVPLGGSSVAGTLGYVSAARELAEQVARGEMPEPDMIVTALGSGGTVAGLAVGLEAAGLRTRILAVAVSSPSAMHAAMMRNLVKRASKRVPGVDPKRAVARVTVDAERIGEGYGHATRAGDEATTLARTQGLTLDPTYTAKSFAGLLAERDVRERGGERSTLLFWHTLSSVPMAKLLERAPGRIEGDLASLLLDPSGQAHAART